MKRSKNIEKRKERAVEQKTKLLHNIEKYSPLILSPVEFVKDRIVEAKNISLFYDDKKVCENINFDIKNGDRIAVCGKNGSGKSSILKLLCGKDIHYKGDLYIGSGVKISYVSQSTDGLCGNLSNFAEYNNVDESLFKTVLIKLDFSREELNNDISNFSAGQKKKVLIAKSICERANLYVWDEPLNFIDIFSRIQIENVILEYSPTIIFVEHDAAFREKIATKIVSI